MDKSEESEQYLESHPITRELHRLGVTDAQMECLRFSGNNDGLPFDQWSYKGGSEPLPLKASILIKPYCALKWLILDDPPPPSRDRDDAWRLVVDMLAAPLFEMAMSHKAAQRARAKRPRSKVGEDGETIAGIIKKLLNNEETIDLKPKELWPHLYAALDSAGLGPKEVKHETDFKKIAYAYETAAGIRKISFGRFTSIISEHRRGKKSR